MKVHDFLSTETETEAAIADVASRAKAAFGDNRPDLGVVFLTPHHVPELPKLSEAIVEATGVRTLLGCTAESVIAEGREVERSHALGCWLASLPGVELHPFHLEHRSTEDAIGFEGLPPEIKGERDGHRVLVLLGEPFTFPVDEFVREFNETHPGIPIVGGMASGAMAPGYNRLLYQRGIHAEGAVGVFLTGDVQVRTVVSQGCRPIGRRLVITAVDQNVIFELAGQPVAQCVNDLLQELKDDERFLFEKGPHVGVAIDEYREEFRRGDFLIRNILGWDSQTGGLVVNDEFRRGQTVQFHVRDAAAAAEDLEVLLSKNVEEEGDVAAEGGLLFSCNGRGTRLFPGPDHDVKTVREQVGAIPMAGFFAAGEIGPVGGRNFLHGFTASMVLFSGKGE